MCCWDGHQGFADPKQTLYQLSHRPVIFIVSISSLLGGLLVDIIRFLFFQIIAVVFIEIKFHYAAQPDLQFTVTLHLSFPGAEMIDVSIYAQLAFVELGLMWSTSANVPSELKASILLLWNEMECLVFYYSITYIPHTWFFAVRRGFMFVCFDNAVSVDQPGNGNGVTWLTHPVNGPSNTTGFKLAVNLPVPLSTSF